MAAAGTRRQGALGGGLVLGLGLLADDPAGLPAREPPIDGLAKVVEEPGPRTGCVTGAGWYADPVGAGR